MSKDANPAELRTPVILEAYEEARDNDGYKQKRWANVFGQDVDGNDRLLYVKWVNLHGSEAWEAMAHKLKDPATLTSRFTPLISEQCRILRLSDKPKRDALLAAGKQAEADALCFEVISMDNVEERREWLELRVQRKVAAK